ncbi:hypothetical protein ACFPVS_10360 [Neisseria weixii]|uniref:Uncharacterized protein n=1 Tax=Neisseria weixii TaxID=1853276 RepID=A0A3N4MNE4_9NEIS|nr:hypothetical protein [Neisseria weixii]RPD84718.1 hypothetical protein EGK74_10775 [Neisseria weixii]
MFDYTFEQRVAVDMFAHHDSGLLVEEAAHKKIPLNSLGNLEEFWFFCKGVGLKDYLMPNNQRV